MAATAPQPATKGTFACFPFKFLFGDNKEKRYSQPHPPTHPPYLSTYLRLPSQPPTHHRTFPHPKHSMKANKNKNKQASDAPTDSYGGGSSIMSVGDGENR